MTCIVAIDPGVTGALAFYFIDVPDRVSVLDMPVVDGEVNAHALLDLIKSYEPDIAAIEQVGPMPRDGVRQAWRFSAAYSTAKTVVTVLDIPMTLVTPSLWKKTMRWPAAQSARRNAAPRPSSCFRRARRHSRARRMPAAPKQHSWPATPHNSCKPGGPHDH